MSINLKIHPEYLKIPSLIYPSFSTVSPSVWAGRVAIRAPSGGSVTLQCTAEAYPVPQVHWTLNGEHRLINGKIINVTVDFVLWGNLEGICQMKNDDNDL